MLHVSVKHTAIPHEVERWGSAGRKGSEERVSQLHSAVLKFKANGGIDIARSVKSA